MNFRIIRALLKKDSALFIANRFYLLITVIGLLFYIAVYFILPAQVDQELKLAVFAPGLPQFLDQIPGKEGIRLVTFPSAANLRQAVDRGDYQAGIALPDSWPAFGTSGDPPVITIYYSSSASEDLQAALEILVKELAYIPAGQPLNFEVSTSVLGPNRLDSQIALRDRLRPLLVVFILLVEILSLASLIATEIEQGTARALLTTPLRISDLLLAKGILGGGLALIQAALFMGLVGGFSQQPWIILVALVAGSLMSVGIGFLLASLARDVNAVTGWGILIMVLMSVPGLAIVLPGLTTNWTKFIPSYFLADAVSRVANYGAGWQEAGLNLAILAIFSAAVIWAGTLVLRRRYR